MAIRPVVVSFQAEGVREIQKSFQAISNAAAAAEKATARSNERATTTTLRSHQKVSDSKKKETKAALDADEKLAASKKKLAAQIEAIERRQSDRKMREIERELRQSIAADERAAAQKIRLSEKTAAAQKRIREREIAAEKRVYSGVGRLVGGSTSRVLGSLGGVAGGALAVGGGFSVVDALQTNIANRGKAKEIAIQSGGAISRDQLLNQAQSIALRYGFKTEDALQAADEFGQKSGKYEAIGTVLEDVMKISNATGATPADMANMMGIFQANGGDAAQSTSFALIAAGMGRKGSIDPRDLAKSGGTISSASNRYQDKDKAFRQLNALTQIAAARGGANGAEEATLSVSRFTSDISKKRDLFKQMTHGVSAYDANNSQMKDPYENLRNIISATHGDDGKLAELFDERGIRAVQGLTSLYREGYNSTKGTESQKNDAGIKKMMEAINEMETATLTMSQVEKESADRMQETDKKLAATFEKLRIEVGDKLAPKFVEMIPVLERAIPAFTDMLDFATKNPFSSVGILIAGAITKDIAAAGIGKGVELAVTKAASIISSSGTSIGAQLGAVGVIIATAGLALEKGIEHINEVFDKKAKKQSEEAMSGAQIEQRRADLVDKVRKGTANQSDIEEAKRYLTAGEAGLDEQKKGLDPENATLTEKLIIAAGSGAIGKWAGMEDALATESSAKWQTYDRTKKSIEDFAKTIEQASQELKRLKAPGGDGGGKSNDNSPDRIVPIASPARSSG